MLDSSSLLWLGRFLTRGFDFPRMIANNRAGNVTEKARLSRGARRWPSAAPGTCGRCSHSQLHVV